MLIRIIIFVSTCVLLTNAQNEPDVAMGEILRDSDPAPLRFSTGQTAASQEEEDNEFFAGIRDDAMMQQVLSDLNGLESAIERQKLTRGGNVSDLALETMAGMKRFVDLKRLIAWLQPVDKRISRYCYYGCWCLPAGAHKFVTGQGRPVDEVDKACMYLWFCYTCARQEFGVCNPDTRRYSRQMTWDASAPGDHSKRGIRCTNQWRRYNRQSKYNCARAICECDRGISVRLFAHWRTWSKRRHRLWSADLATPFTVETHCLKPDSPQNGPDQDFVCCGKYGEDGSRWPTRDQGGFRACCNKPVSAGLPWNGQMYSTITEDCCEQDGIIVPMGDSCPDGTSDDNECSLGTHDCTGEDAGAEAVATCHNADNYFFCTCDSEYYGLTPQMGIHGKHICRNIDECEAYGPAMHDCGGVGAAGAMASVCVDMNPKFMCNCVGLFTHEAGVTGRAGQPNSCFCDTSLNQHLDGMDCKINVCECENGMPVGQANCPVNGANNCMSCDAGYHPVGSDCVENTCTCDGGMEVPAGDARCATDGANVCMSCGVGHHENGDCVNDGCQCDDNVCSCSGGMKVPDGDARCANDGDDVCMSCDAGYMENGDCVNNGCACAANQCACPVHGSSAAQLWATGDNGKICDGHLDEQCMDDNSQCGAGYSYNENNGFDPIDDTCNAFSGCMCVFGAGCDAQGNGLGNGGMCQAYGWASYVTTGGPNDGEEVVCPSADEVGCTSRHCDGFASPPTLGHHFDGIDACVANQCTCPAHGSAPDQVWTSFNTPCLVHGGTQCNSDGSQCDTGFGYNHDGSTDNICSVCAAGYTHDGTSCVANVCSCPTHGDTAAQVWSTGDNAQTCDGMGDEQCMDDNSQCAAGFSYNENTHGQAVTDICNPFVNCSCTFNTDSGNFSNNQNWSSGPGQICPSANEVVCTPANCDDTFLGGAARITGFHHDGANACVENVCTCPLHGSLPNRDWTHDTHLCQVHLSRQCEADSSGCDTGFTFNGDGSTENICSQ